MNFKLSYLGKEQTIATACNSKGYWISRQIWIGLISNSQLTHAYPQIWSLHTTHIFTTQATVTCCRVMGCGGGNLNPKTNFTLRKVLVICHSPGRFTGSLSNALFLCVIKRRLQLLTLHEVGNRRVNWYRQLVEWHFGHHKSHTHQSRIDPTFCIHCSFMLCCSTAPYKTCNIWPLSFLVFNNLVVPHEPSAENSVSCPVLCWCVTVS